MKLVVGLGNPGKRYKSSRHNVGFMVLDELARQFSFIQRSMKVFNFQFSIDKRLRAEFLKTKYKDQEILLAKPQTMVNASGVAVKSLIANYSITDYSDLLVVHDDIDLPLGKIKVVKGRGSAGHRGVESIIKELKTNDFVRFRLGIGRFTKAVSKDIKKQEVVRYVLGTFGKKEKVEVEKMIDKAVKAIKFALEYGFEKTQARFGII